MCKRTTEKENYRLVSLMNRERRIQQNSDKPNSRTHQQDQVDFMPETQHWLNKCKSGCIIQHKTDLRTELHDQLNRCRKGL